MKDSYRCTWQRTIPICNLHMLAVAEKAAYLIKGLLVHGRKKVMEFKLVNRASMLININQDKIL